MVSQTVIDFTLVSAIKDDMRLSAKMERSQTCDKSLYQCEVDALTDFSDAVQHS
jgi:hypothetical protein